MTLLVCFPLDVKCAEAGGKWVAGEAERRGRVKEQAKHGHTVFKVARHKESVTDNLL